MFCFGHLKKPKSLVTAYSKGRFISMYDKIHYKLKKKKKEKTVQIKMKKQKKQKKKNKKNRWWVAGGNSPTLSLEWNCKMQRTEQARTSKVQKYSY